jgi:hypothetical protein
MKTIFLVLFSLFVAAGSVEAQQSEPSAVPVPLPQATVKRIRSYPCPMAPKSWRMSTTCRAARNTLRPPVPATSSSIKCRA